MAARTRDMTGLAERGLQPLARKLHEPEARDLAHLYARTVVAKRLAQSIFDVALITLILHVDEVDDDQSAQIAQAELARQLLRGFEVGTQRRLLDVRTARGARGVDVDRDHRFRMVDHDRPAGRQRYLPRVCGLDLMFDLESGEQ